MAIIDDSYLLGRMNHIFAANRTLAVDLAKVGLELQPAKSQCYIREGLRNAEWDEARGSIPNGVLKDTNGNEIIVDNAPL